MSTDIDWARIPADQIAAIQASLERARDGTEDDLERPLPTTAVEAVDQWATDNYKGGAVTFERMVEALGVLAEWIDGHGGRWVGTVDDLVMDTQDDLSPTEEPT